ncbi:hypothetical protein A2714_04855 [Candidatus Woesebacteria bacterium RIFCSPHIGHO2_01_FULL_38_9]|uniref:Uncharacterized protein n=2 Tax=Candidatus Woeseibacteriota TaxID=1752722 RepID=A0A1F7XZB1_9BACT|nr:MAG: hypothetical protein A2714_04855 [Candidatus Woesebacteria bacterium RIFCSPHIGHO2_01_FULL_38_9]OGM58875.1 MAG: hypothetical protein A3A75_06455 [Candidatus Woesebacteria bacterium RIFCSPLOWO2_01_FULL_39_10]
MSVHICFKKKFPAIFWYLVEKFFAKNAPTNYPETLLIWVQKIREGTLSMYTIDEIVYIL